MRNDSSDQEVSSDVSGIEGELAWPHLSSPKGYQSPQILSSTCQRSVDALDPTGISDRERFLSISN